MHPDDCDVIVGEAEREMAKLPRRKFRLVFTDPPYNLGFKYDADPTGDQLPAPSTSLDDRRASRGARAAHPDGALCVMICEEWVADFGAAARTPGCTSAG
jgi:DNA modification methylase